MKTLSLWIAGLVVMSASAGESPAVAYPHGYRHWLHVKSMELKAGHPLYEAFGGLHHIYANAKAEKGYRTGKFADGAVIVFDLLEVRTEGHALVEGPRKVLGVMSRHKTRYADTGGWGFEAFAAGDPKKPLVGDKAAKACFECHAPQKANHYLFSTLRD